MLEPIVALCLLAAFVAGVAITSAVRRRRRRRVAAAVAPPQVDPGPRSGSRSGEWMQVVARYGGPDGRQPANQSFRPASRGDGSPTIGVTVTNLSATCTLTGDVVAVCECPECTELREKMNRR